MCVYVSGHRIPQETGKAPQVCSHLRKILIILSLFFLSACWLAEAALGVELQLDRMKQPTTRRILMLLTNQPLERRKLMVQREVGGACVNWTAYLRVSERKTWNRKSVWHLSECVCVFSLKKRFGINWVRSSSLWISASSILPSMLCCTDRHTLLHRSVWDTHTYLYF